MAAAVRASGDQDPSAQALRNCVWLEIRPEVPASPRVLAWDLGPGESAVLELALAVPGSTAVIDDLAARRCAAVIAQVVG